MGRGFNGIWTRFIESGRDKEDSIDGKKEDRDKEERLL